MQNDLHLWIGICSANYRSEVSFNLSKQFNLLWVRRMIVFRQPFVADPVK